MPETTAPLAPAGAAPAGSDGGPLSPAGVRILKIAIVVMGVLIVLGLAGVVARIFYLASTRPPQATRQTAASRALPVVPEATLSLPAGAVIRSVSLDGGSMAVAFDAPAGAGIVIVDVASGRAVSRWHIGPEPPR